MISIIIPTYNQNQLLDECIDSIRKHTEDYEIILVDNGSVPEYEYEHLADVKLTVIYNKQNEGFPKAINQGIKEANGKIIILLNNDCIVTPYWSERLINGLQQYDIVGPLTNYCSGVQMVLTPVYNNEEELDKVAIDWTSVCPGKIFETDYVIGFCMVFKKELYEDIGLFDESLWPCSGEEIDFCLRAKEKGYKIGVCCDVYIHHHGSQTFRWMQEKGIVNYRKICERNDRHLNSKWKEKFPIQEVV